MPDWANFGIVGKVPRRAPRWMNVHETVRTGHVEKYNGAVATLSANAFCPLRSDGEGFSAIDGRDSSRV